MCLQKAGESRFLAWTEMPCKLSIRLKFVMLPLSRPDEGMQRLSGHGFLPVLLGIWWRYPSQYRIEYVVDPF
jgi:hypothetical protein